MNEQVDNPFNPQFGKRPSAFIGRDVIINDFLQGMNNPNDPSRTSIITGIRGSGKTAILADIHQNLDPKKCLVVDITAKDGMLLDILDICVRDGKRWLSGSFNEFTGFTFGALGFSFGVTRKNRHEEHGFRYWLTEILESLKNKKIPTVFLIDEVHNETAEMREFATTYQHMVRENMDVALLMAGLPGSVQDILNDKVLTFLRRSNRVYLENIDVRVVAIAYENAFKKAKRLFEGNALEQAAKASEGYPYLVQLLGFFIWRGAGDSIKGIDVDQALLQSKIELYKNVHDLIYFELSQRDRDFLSAMAEDAAESSFGDIAERMKVSSGYASRYRQRLITAGIIHSCSYGKLAFSPPYMREYLLER